MGLNNMKKFAEIWLQLHRFVHYETVYCITLNTDISFHSQDEYQIRSYHQKEQILEDKVILIEALSVSRHFDTD